jgi:hypothetical protein
LLYNINKCLLLITLSTLVGNAQQIGNYVSNGSFEDLYTCQGPTYLLAKVKYWSSVDSQSVGGGFFNTCNSSAPLNAHTYQLARTGKGYVIGTFFWYNNGRGYLKNQLKQPLSSGKTYCVTFHINIANTSPRGMNGFSAFLGDDIPLSFMLPQINNTYNNVISDTLNWLPITGTFVADGTEKVLVIGNFLADQYVITTPIYSPYFPENWTDVCVDDVSCIEVDLQAYAGPDLSIVPGDSAFIGRQSDFAIDPGCRWFQLPAMTPLDTTSGIWVKPIVTTTYVVRQELECSSEKWDTVVVHMNLVGLSDFGELNRSVSVFPSPAHDQLRVTFRNTTDKVFYRYTLIDHLGRAIREEKLIFEDASATIDTRDLSPGVYSIQLQTFNSEIVSKRFVIAR